MTTRAPVDRHLDIWCHCSLLDCCHNEDADRFNCGSSRHDGHVHSGNPATGYLYPWTQQEYDAQQRYWNRPDPDDYPEGTLQHLVMEAELEDWRKREHELARAGHHPGRAPASIWPCSGRHLRKRGKGAGQRDWPRLVDGRSSGPPRDLRQCWGQIT